MKDECPKQPQTNYLGHSRGWGGCLSSLKWTALLSCVTVVIFYFILQAYARILLKVPSFCQGRQWELQDPSTAKANVRWGQSLSRSQVWWNPTKWEQSNGHLIQLCQIWLNKCRVQTTSFSDGAEGKINKIQEVKCWIGDYFPFV